MSGNFFEALGLKKKRSGGCGGVNNGTFPGTGLTYEERAELFDDLLEDDTSVFPLLDAPREVLATIGGFLEATNLAEVGLLCARAQKPLEEALGDAWTALLLRDFAPRSRAKRYRAHGGFGAGPCGGVPADDHGRLHRSVGLVLREIDHCRVEWDGILVVAPPHLRYRLLQTLHALRNRWGGRMAQCWEWFATRGVRRTTHGQLERHVAGYRRPAGGARVADDFDEVSHQASLDRDLRQRHRECNPKDIISSVKRSLGLAAPELASVLPEANSVGSASVGCIGDDVLSALSPTARDQRLQETAQAVAVVDAGTTEPLSGASMLSLPSPDIVEKMSFAEQLDLALKVSQSSDVAASEEPSISLPSPGMATTPSLKYKLPWVADTQGPAAFATEECDDVEADSSVLLRLQAQHAPGKPGEPLEVVLQKFSVGETIAVAEQLRRPLDQVALRLVRADWLLFYESVSVEARLRARAVAYHLRREWWLSRGPPLVRRLVDLEAELLRLPLFAASANGKCPGLMESHGGYDTNAVAAEEEHLDAFLCAWEEHEEWTSVLEEHVGPLEVCIDRERANNVQHGRAHTPHVADLCRLAFRNFAICEGRLFFAVALALYSLIARLLSETSVSSGGRGLELLQRFYAMAEVYDVQDDALAQQRSTLQQYRYYILKPLARARVRLVPDADLNEDDYEEVPLV